jgi:hypothetical protein
MQPVNVKLATSNVKEEVSQVNNKTEMSNLATVTFQGQRVQDDSIILIIIASLQLPFVFNLFHCSEYNLLREFSGNYIFWPSNKTDNIHSVQGNMLHVIKNQKCEYIKHTPM